MKKIISVGISLFLFFSCHLKTEKISDDTNGLNEETLSIEEIIELPPLENGDFFYKNKNPFGDIIELTGVNIQPDDDFIFKISEGKMLIKGDILALSNGVGAPFILFNYPDLTLKTEAGIRGNGPDEFLLTGLVPTISEDFLCFIYEGTRNKLYRFYENGEIVADSFSFQSYTTGSFGSSIESGGIYQINQKSFLYVDNSRTGKSIYSIREEEGNVIREEIVSLQLNPKRKSPFTYTGDFAVNVERNRMVYAYKYFKIIKFMDMEANIIKTINFQQSEFDDGTLSIADGLDQNVTHYWGVSPQQDHVYFLHSGRTPHQVHSERQKNVPYIYVEQYDWNGNPVRKFKLDNWGYFTVDEKNNRLLLGSFNFDDPFVEYILPD